MPSPCARCNEARAIIVRPKNHQRLCKTCFISVFEAEIHQTITTNSLFHPGEKVAIGASGGKDSTVLASVLKTLNERYNYGLELILLAIDEGIKGYRDDALKTVVRNAEQYEMPLRIVGYDELYGWTMDQVVEQIGKKGNCTYCGVFRRQALDRGAAMLRVQHVVTGHNADDMAETVMMNLLRGDLPRLSRSTSIITSTTHPASSTPNDLASIKRSKPLKYAYEKEIVLYAHHKKLDYFSTECIYSPEAFRGTARALIKDLERVRPSAILDIVRSGEDMAKLCPGYDGKKDNCDGDCSTTIKQKEAVEVDDEGAAGGCGNAKGQNVDEMMRVNEYLAKKEHHLELDVNPPTTNGSTTEQDLTKPRSKKQKGQPKPVKQPVKQTLGQCVRCGYMSSQSICKACMLLEGLNRNRPKTDISVAPTPVNGDEVDINAFEQSGTVSQITRHMADLATVPG